MLSLSARVVHVSARVLLVLFALQADAADAHAAATEQKHHADQESTGECDWTKGPKCNRGPCSLASEPREMRSRPVPFPVLFPLKLAPTRPC